MKIVKTFFINTIEARIVSPFKIKELHYEQNIQGIFENSIFIWPF